MCRGYYSSNYINLYIYRMKNTENIFSLLMSKVAICQSVKIYIFYISGVKSKAYVTNAN